jgi:PH and SEC7 domain-containing protein
VALFQYPPKSTTLAKAVDNWNKRSSYLLTETVKYELYIDSLKAAMKERQKRRGEKALEKALDQISPPVGKWGFKQEDTIEETDEPTTPGPAHGKFKHRREGAGANAANR